MTRRWGGVAGATAFRAEPSVAAERPSARQSVALLSVLALIVGTVVTLSVLVKPDRARTFDLLHGSVFLADQVGPVAVDLPSGKPTLRLLNVNKQFGKHLQNLADLSVVPAGDATVLLDRTTGEFNMAAATGFVVKQDGSGVLPAGPTAGTTSAAYPTGNPDDPGQAYIVRTATNATDVFLVDESTVAQVVGAGKPVPQASSHLRFGVTTGVGSAVSDGRNLWALQGATAGSYAVHELRPPASRTRDGVRLTDHLRARVAGGAALEATTTAHGAAVAVASGQRLQIFHADGTTTRAGIHGAETAQSVMPVSSTAGRFVYLLRTPAGWSIVSIAADGTGLRGPVPLSGVAPQATLAPPAMSGDDVYTIDRSSGAIYRVNLAGTAIALKDPARYPVAATEKPDVSDAYLLAHGPRVFVDSPSHVQAVTIFTDRGARAAVIEKGQAVGVSAAGNANTLAEGNLAGKGGKSRSAGKPKRPVVAIDNNTDCSATVKQTPHQPVIGFPQPAATSVTLSWSYQTLDRGECFPSEYQIAVRQAGSGAEQSATVVGRTSTTLGGLAPHTLYTVTVTAFRAGVPGLPSEPVTFRTTRTGPEAPSGLSVSADATGNWVLNWRGCVAVTCAPVGHWTVTATTCDHGRGIVNLPTRIAPAAFGVEDQPDYTYAGNDELLGRGLQFTVTGVGRDGLTGTPSAPSACAYSHAAANLAAATLTASTPDTTAFGHDALAKVSLDLGSNPVRTLGGVGATVNFVLTGGGTTKQQAVEFDGTQTNLTATFSGVRAGTAYRASVTVTPPHGGPPASVQGAPVQTRSEWPAVALTATCTPTTPNPPNPPACDLELGLGGISSAAAGGEFFDFTGTLKCGQTSTKDGLVRTHFDPADTDSDPITVELSQLNGLYGACSVSGTLQESSSDTHFFGGLPLSLGPVDVNLGDPVTADVSASDFSAAFVDHDGAAAEIRYTGANTALGQLTLGWSETLIAPNGSTDCSDPAQTGLPGTDDAHAVYIPVLRSCVESNGGQPVTWTVQLKYSDAVTGDQHSVAVNLSGVPSGFQPCAPLGFDAAWNTPATDGATVTYTGDASQLGGCSDFTYQLIDPTGTVCDEADHVDPNTAQPLTWSTCGAPDPSDGWTVRVTWHNEVTDSDDGTPALQLGRPPHP